MLQINWILEYMALIWNIKFLNHYLVIGFLGSFYMLQTWTGHVF